MDHAQLASVGIVELSLTADALMNAQRLDLACHATLTLVRAAWAAGGDRPEAALVADAAGDTFEIYANPLVGLDKLPNALDGPLIQSPFGWATYPVKAIRTAELLGLLTLQMQAHGEPRADEVSDLLAEVVANHPSCALRPPPRGPLLRIYHPRRARPARPSRRVRGDAPQTSRAMARRALRERTGARRR